MSLAYSVDRSDASLSNVLIPHLPAAIDMWPVMRIVATKSSWTSGVSLRPTRLPMLKVVTLRAMREELAAQGCASANTLSC